MANQVNVYIDDKIYEAIVREAGKRQHESGKRCPLSNIVSEIFIPAAHEYFNGHNPENVSKRRY